MTHNPKSLVQDILKPHEYKFTGEKIIVTHWHNDGGVLSGIRKGGVYNAIMPAPKGYYGGDGEKWVLCEGRPVRLLKHEFLYYSAFLKNMKNKFDCPFCNSNNN